MANREAIIGEIETRLEEHELGLYELYEAVGKLWLESGRTRGMYYKNHYAALHVVEARKEGDDVGS